MTTKAQERAANAIPFQVKEKSSQGKALDASVNALVEVMQELYSVGKPGLPERVCLAFDDVLSRSMRLARSAKK